MRILTRISENLEKSVKIFGQFFREIFRYFQKNIFIRVLVVKTLPLIVYDDVRLFSYAN